MTAVMESWFRVNQRFFRRVELERPKLFEFEKEGYSVEKLQRIAMRFKQSAKIGIPLVTICKF